MKQLIILLSLIAFYFTCQQPQDQEADEAAIKARWDTFATAWNNQDGKGMAATYAEDGFLLDPFGTEAKGTTNIEALLGKTVTKFLRNSTTSFTIEHIRFLKPDVAFVDGTQTVSGAISPEGTNLPEMKFHVVGSMIKKDGSWWFVDARPYQFMTPPASMPIN